MFIMDVRCGPKVDNIVPKIEQFRGFFHRAKITGSYLKNPRFCPIWGLSWPTLGQNLVTQCLCKSHIAFHAKRHFEMEMKAWEWNKQRMWLSAGVIFAAHPRLGRKFNLLSVSGRMGIYFWPNGVCHKRILGFSEKYFISLCSHSWTSMEN